LTVVPVVGGGSFSVRRIYCVGRNYLDHIREMGEADERDPPFFFQKPTDAIVLDGSVVPYPPFTSDYQYEVELVAAIGGGGRHIPAGEALGHVFGYAIGLDMTRRDRQREARALQLPWEMGKSFDQSAPCGPIHKAASVGHPAAGEITLAVNGVGKQAGDLRALIWPLPDIIARLSEQYHLMTGDLIYTGTPAGVGPVVPGDVMVGRIAGLGTLTITVGPKEG
jgi:fumarylpyruvate hydrolase